jgi:uncharacterized membrane protein
MSSPRLLAAILAALSLVCLTGCAGFSNGGSTQQSNQTNVAADFAVAVNPASASVAKGASSTLTANVTAQGGFNGSVQMALFGLPSGVTATFSSSTVTGSGTPTITMAAATTAASGTYTLTLSATSGTTTHNTSFSLAVTGTGITPDFSISTNPNQQSIGVGGTETFNVTVIALNDFLDTVNLTVSGLPAGMSASFSPASIRGSGISTLTITTDSTAVAGTSTLTVSGAGSSVSHSVTVGVTVTTTAPPPDFALTVEPSSQTVATGGSTSVTVGVAPTNGFSGTVALAESGMPAGMTASCTPTSITTSNNTAGSCTLNISTNAAVVAGTYNLTVTGTSGGLSHSGVVSIVVTPIVLTPDFSVSATPSSHTVTAGSSTTYTASVAALNSFTGVVTMTVSGLPTGVAASFASTTVTGSGSSTLTLTSASTTAAGTYFVSITGTSGTLVHSMNVALTVTVPPPDFALTVGPPSQTVEAGESTSVTVSVTPANGFTGTVALVESGMPAGMTASCTPSSITTSNNTAGSCMLNISSTASTSAGTYVLTITGTSGGLSHSGAVSVVVTPVVLTPDFSLSATPSSQTVTAGNSTTYTASVAALNSFTGIVTMTATGLPTGVTASFAPTTVTGSGNSTLTLNSASTTAAGTYFVSITGTSGALVHSTNVSLTVTAAGVAMNVLSAPGAVGDPYFKTDVPLYLYNNSTVSGATIAMEWGGVDQGPSAGSGQYDWSYPDTAIAPWIAAGKKVNLVVWANADSSSTNCAVEGQYGLGSSANCAIPAYVWTALGSSNITTCTSQYGTQQMPNYYATAFQSNYQKFMAAMIQHYSGNASVGYIRFGLGHGGESLPVSVWNDTTVACGQAYVNAWGMTVQNWESYLGAMLNYEGSLNSPVQLLVGLTPMGNPAATVPEYAAPIAVQNHIGFGSQGLQESDVNNCGTSVADWCDLFNQYTGQVPLELQTVGQSCPLGGCATGSLADLVPFAVANHVTIMEIYYQDWLTAYDPNYPGYYPGYQAVLKAAAGK